MPLMGAIDGAMMNFGMACAYKGTDERMATAEAIREAAREYARAYAAEQTRELVEALAELIEGAEYMLGTCGAVRGDTPEDADEHTHDDWAEEFLTERTKAAINVYGKHKGAA